MSETLARAGTTEPVRVVTFDGQARSERDDRVAGEEPLEIRVRAGGASKTIAITMRTPGHDFELAAGFLFGEGIVASIGDIHEMTYCLDGSVDADQQYNIVNVDLARNDLPDLVALERHFTTTSACGVCGRATLEALRERGVPTVESELRVAPAVITGLPDTLRERQRGFEATGGLHAAARFDANGKLQAVREDVGRHNAFDKLIGNALIEHKLPLANELVMVSGRTSYELVQKTIAAGAPILCAVSAPSSLAVALARDFGITLIGFLRGARFNVYSHDARITSSPSPLSPQAESRGSRNDGDRGGPSTPLGMT
jgi:FdhD protein